MLIQIGLNDVIKIKNAIKLVETGADVLLAGSYVFKSENSIEAIKGLKEITA
jgi:ribulose-phosphate 3-epimerase